MRVMLVGTSNSIYKDGYRAEFENNPDITHFHYRGIGASASTILPWLIADEDLSQFDFLVIETSINDVSQYVKGVLTAEQILENLRWACARATAAGCKPVILNMPTLGGTRKRNIADQLHPLVASEFRTAFIDGQDFVRSACILKEKKPEFFFRDPSHLKVNFGRMMGKLAVARLKTMGSAKCLKASLDYDFRNIMATTLGSQVISRTNSLMSITSAPFALGESFSANIGAGNSLVGVALNRVESWGYLDLEGREAVSLPLKSSFSRQEVSFLAGVLPPPPDVLPDASGNLTFRLSETPGGRQLMTTSKADNENPVSGAQIEVMGLIVRTAA